MVRLLPSMLLQLVAAVAAWFFIAPMRYPTEWAVVQGLFALAGSMVLRQPGWQKIVQLLFCPVLVTMLALHLPAWGYLVAFVITFAVGRNAVVERVPLYRSSLDTVNALAELLPERAVFLEAGCGEGRLALALAAKRPDVVILGLENAWGNWLMAYLRWWLTGHPNNVKFSCRSFWKEDWGRFDAVYVFLSPEPMPRVWTKFVTEGSPDSVLISNTFLVPDVPPDSHVSLGHVLQKELLIWRCPHGA